MSASASSPSSKDAFRRFCTWVSGAVGAPRAFVGALVIIVVWAAVGPWYHWSDTWQLVINTSTSIVTFMMVFLIQNTQNRDGKAIQLKLDELIRAVKGARNRLVELENCTDEELEELKEEFAKIRERAGGHKKQITDSKLAHVEAEQEKRSKQNS